MGEWLREFDKEIDSITKRFRPMKKTDEKGEVVKEIFKFFLNIWIRFAIDLGLELKLTPMQWEIANYEGKKQWVLREDFNFKEVNEIVLANEGADHYYGLRSDIYTFHGVETLKIVCSLQEGKEKRTDYLIFISPTKDVDFHELWERVGAMIKIWYEAHLKGEPSLIWEHCRERLQVDSK
jgi:hypothetical protein